MESTNTKLALAAHVLRAMAFAHEDGRRSDLDSLTHDLGVRRADVRSTLTRLHEEGLVDVTRMRLTLDGWALGHAFATRKLRDLRELRALAHSNAA